MPKAEVGSTKYLNNKLKSKGLQRLRWYCQVCERQMRDENGFKMHTQAESHVRQMLLVGKDPKKYINDYSNQFQRDFLQPLRTSHGEKKVQLNHFYQDYISNKEHGICRVEEDEKGIHVAWIDNSPKALRKQDAIRKKERQDKGDEEREQMLIRQQVKRAQMDAESRSDTELDETERGLKHEEGEKIKLSFGAKPAVAKPESSSAPVGRIINAEDSSALPAVDAEQPTTANSGEETNEAASVKQKESTETVTEAATAPAKVFLKMGFSSKPKNVFAAAKNTLGGKKAAVIEQPQKMSEAERIMKEEIERKKKRGSSGFGSPAQEKQRF
ncbi:hypothetical protein G7Y89_g5529 [Cudoniella acicularis]|uniref:C2H2-type domain-containing protein n=1 Tax=Cudoniella acicularis TaxID=354080 RepID=A0A8H4RN52_9HELO|nr:hypothetical protein G7Y89_g5529 [Cudoniella acicularis]